MNSTNGNPRTQWEGLMLGKSIHKWWGVTLPGLIAEGIFIWSGIGGKQSVDF